MIAKLLLQIVAGAVGAIGGKDKAKREERANKVNAISANMQRSGTDEALLFFWFYPNLLAIFSTDAAINYINAMSSIDPQWREVQLGISIAIFGLGKVGGRKK